MKNYVIATRITMGLSVVSLGFILFIHYYFSGTEADFWCNVCLAIFGSSLLTFITSIIGYFTEKRKTLESFFYSTSSLLHIINQYDINWDLEKKIDFFISYSNVDKSLWDSQLGSIYFLNDFQRKKFKYIYDSIYKPIIDFNQAVRNHEFHFIWHKDGSGKNDAVMKKFIFELEEQLIQKISNEYSINEKDTVCTISTKNRLVSAINSELNGKYYDLMYKKKKERMSKWKK